MPINRIAIFSGLSAKQKRARSNFTECTRSCRKSAPTGKAYGPCLSKCLNTKSKPKKSRTKGRVWSGNMLVTKSRKRKSRK